MFHRRGFVLGVGRCFYQVRRRRRFAREIPTKNTDRSVVTSAQYVSFSIASMMTESNSSPLLLWIVIILTDRSSENRASAATKSFVDFHSA